MWITWIQSLIYSGFVPSMHSPRGIVMQTEDNILEWMLLPHKESKKLKTQVKKVSELILKAKLRLCQLTGIDPTEIVIYLTNAEMASLWAKNGQQQRVCSNSLRQIRNKHPRSKKLQFLKTTHWILPRNTKFLEPPTFYMDTNKSGKTDNES